jgi:hypothetical protein
VLPRAIKQLQLKSGLSKSGCDIISPPPLNYELQVMSEVFHLLFSYIYIYTYHIFINEYGTNWGLHDFVVYHARMFMPRRLSLRS